MQIFLQCSGGLSGQVEFTPGTQTIAGILSSEAHVGWIVSFSFSKSIKVCLLPPRRLREGGYMAPDGADCSRAGTSGCCAHRRLLKGGYKWMLWADDDTMWFTAGARRLLRRWDHTAVHAVTGAPGTMHAIMFSAPTLPSISFPPARNARKGSLALLP